MNTEQTNTAPVVENRFVGQDVVTVVESIRRFCVEEYSGDTGYPPRMKGSQYWHSEPDLTKNGTVSLADTVIPVLQSEEFTLIDKLQLAKILTHDNVFDADQGHITDSTPDALADVIINQFIDGIRFCEDMLFFEKI